MATEPAIGLKNRHIDGVCKNGGPTTMTLLHFLDHGLVLWQFLYFSISEKKQTVQAFRYLYIFCSTFHITQNK